MSRYVFEMLVLSNNLRKTNDLNAIKSYLDLSFDKIISNPLHR